MKNIQIFIAGLVLFLSTSIYAQKAETIKLEQTPGKFTTETLTIKPGNYIFEVSNKGIDHEVAFVLAPKKSEVKESDHIKNAYLNSMLKSGQTSTSKVVNLEKGEYVYFCPMNPTPQYILKVE